MEKILQGKKILLGVTGSIAAYKACSLLRLLQNNGAEVKVVMTKNACEFVAPLTFQTLSKNKVMIDNFEKIGAWDPQHISHADWADILVIAPATANIIAKITYGIADDALSSIALAFLKPILIVPAMNCNMYMNAATQNNFELLRKRGVQLMESATGELACGYSGIGRFPELPKILNEIQKVL